MIGRVDAGNAGANDQDIEVLNTHVYLGCEALGGSMKAGAGRDKQMWFAWEVVQCSQAGSACRRDGAGRWRGLGNKPTVSNASPLRKFHRFRYPRAGCTLKRLQAAGAAYRARMRELARR